MPISVRDIQAPVTFDGSLTVNTTPPTPTATVTGGGKYTNNSIPVIPAGCQHVRIVNTLGESGGDVTVNGATLVPGQVFEDRPNFAGDKLYTLPTYTILNPNGSLVEVYYRT